MSCSFSWLMDFQRIVYRIVPIIWKISDCRKIETGAHQNWGARNDQGIFGKIHPFSLEKITLSSHKGRGSKVTRFFSKAGETAILNCSFYLHSDHLYSVKWYKVNFSSFLSGSGSVIAWLCQWLSGWMNTWWWKVKLLRQKKLLTLTCFLTIWLLEGWLQALQSILTVWEKPGNNQPPLDDSWQLGHSWRQFGIVWMWLVQNF